ncbi:V-type ATP synthase subunit A [Candidatus Falkowbacteria bacterium RIFOXYB2_FULL_34_18]|uniref:V-type ATP synthase alpha chain n=1 Tax=Candidatus Falkowbacteria bacterium RIFOXYD2_FULL_34_120 TaxID=1798007 RepID=A0A1F5TSN2_9BACT|nr:MAG: V-type ATP synthase subunit A [Candidatus Falkowbacteria bacterium RIFOXYB2_FULL_34_18]OGF30172.1 MAG: V-type ATP synthase subunit A [Candidatus Falkowbacteria bacterium RIFOXYC12_FULL_34_55]OGF37679.1 MAG: V-type ATP synthase subunit A [Candidatus Falkowbacteria bacterium RIFOXYC2_FULL_34_220]OGF39406.1 MAG: V-type ATP synthase subunit A [Candidatus Falkowbacteria bacterium RIFOXYD12_FULL_34_57]OGF41935.1 MAG: V-type ATP synthase subunit A [Candidatus Falkowbacteria bacterium RIFOXYD2_
MTNIKHGTIVKVSGPLIVAKGMEDANIYDVVKVSEHKLIGEIIEMRGDKASIQVYEDTSGIGPGEPVYLEGHSLSVELGPGLLTNFYDGIQRPLRLLEEAAGPFITRGISVPGLDRAKKWKFEPIVKNGDKVEEGDIIGTVQETSLVVHKIMVPPGISGTINNIKAGEFTIEEIVAEVGGKKICMLQIWPIRAPRPTKNKLAPREPMITGQRVIDTFFPVVQGGTACVPGPFGAGKTVVQHQLAKWSDTEIVIFIGCGERGNEMTDVLLEFPELEDPKTGKPLMERTVLIANTSNMPVAAREASIYTGITIAEYFRDMGYRVALMADSTSRWAEALREISGRLGEMPGEEGYPAYLGSKTAAFYERAGKVKCLGSESREGALTVVGAVSPPGGDLSEPVTQNTLRVAKVFWGLDDKLAFKRHFPAINWLNSYSLYENDVLDYMRREAGEDWPEIRNEAMNLLQEEARLEEIVRLVGVDALSAREQLVLNTTKSLREDFLHQNAFDDEDTYTSLKKQYYILRSIITFHKEAKRALDREIKLNDLVNLPIKTEVIKCKWLKDNSLYEELIDNVKSEIRKLYG